MSATLVQTETIREATHRQDRERFEREGDVLAFSRPYQAGECEVSFPAGTYVIVDRMGVNGSVRRWAIPPVRSGVRRVRIS